MSAKTPNRLKRVLHMMHESVPVERRLCVEVLEILWSYYLLKQQTCDSDISFENMKAMKFVQLLGNDIILGLCKFRDKDSRSLSFDQVFKELRKRAASKGYVKDIETKMAEYRRLTLNLQSHRDTYIAHLSKRDHAHLNPPTEMLATIRMAVQITDALVGSRNSYKVLDVDLRAEVLGENAAEPGAAPDRGGK
jgi:hypothetical protein